MIHVEEFCVVQDHIFTLISTQDWVEKSVSLTTTSVHQFQTRVVSSSIIIPVLVTQNSSTCIIIMIQDSECQCSACVELMRCMNKP